MRFRNPLVSNKAVANGTDILEGVPVTRTYQDYTVPGKLARSSYDNGFAPISAIVDEIIKRELHLGDVNDPETDVTKQYAFWNAFSRPNDRMGLQQFVDVLVAGFLSLDELSLLVWRVGKDGSAQPGSPEGEENYFDLENIAGFTVIPKTCKTYNAQGDEEWEIDFGSDGGQQKFCRDSVMTLKYSLLPEDGITGVSPGSASAQEAAIRDRLNQQQRAYFDNGATPSIIVTITARNDAEYNAIQQAYEQRNRGAAKSGGVVYQKIIDSGIAGMAQPSIKIDIVGTTNNNLAIKEIVEFTNTTIVSNYGVSPIIYGDASQTTFQNQNLAYSGFMDTVQSCLVRLCGCIENELSRLCNIILPFTFVWEDVELDIVEEQKLKAETKTEYVKSFLALTQSGISPAQAAEVLGLGDSWKSLVITPPATSAPTLNKTEPLAQLALESGCTCPTHNKASLKRVSETEQTAQKKILNLVKKLAKETFDGLKTNATTKEINQQIIDELIAVMEQGANVGTDTITGEAGLDKTLADFSALSKQSLARLEKRATTVTNNYVDFVTKKLNSLPDDDPAKKVFNNFYETYGQSRANLIAQQETKVAYQNGQIDSASNIDGWLKKNQPKSYIVKTWTTTSDAPCRFCKKMNGTEAGIKDSFVPGGLIDPKDGEPALYLDANYSDGTIPDAHSNCQCVFKFSFKSK
jgi:hypothetical protein